MLPQVVSRLAALVAFAIVANAARADVLGVFALISAVLSGAVAIGPAIVAKPLAATADPEERRRRTHLAVSAAAAVAAVASMAFLVGAALTTGLVRLTLLGGALAAWGGLALEGAYWAAVFRAGPRGAGIRLAAAYAAQTLATLLAAAAGFGEALVLVPPATLALGGVLALTRQRPTVPAARTWFTAHRAGWLPYVGGTAASVGMVQAIPLLLTATVGLTGASVFRALELTFGPTNLAATVTTNALLAREGRSGLPRLYRRAGLALAVLALANGSVLLLVPMDVLEALLGHAAQPLRDEGIVATLYRTSYAVSLVGAILLVPVFAARTIGLLNVGVVAGTLSALLVGLLVGGLTGGFAALSVTETAYAVLYATLLARARTADRPALVGAEAPG